MGNPHAIFWVDDVEAYDLARFGPMLENHPIFPERANISLAHVTARDAITVKTWERGVGLTRACGTAACAAAVAAMRKKLDRPPRDGDASRRPARRRMARGRPRLDDRPGRDRVSRAPSTRRRSPGPPPRRARRDARAREPLPPTSPSRGGRNSPPRRISRGRACLRERHSPLPKPASPVSTSPQGGGSSRTTPDDIQVLTFGCRLNALESEVMRARAAEAGLGDAVLVNTCAVTAEAVRQARQAIRQARREHPEARIVVTGCAAQIDPEASPRMPEVDLVLGNAEKLDAASYRIPDFASARPARSASTTSCRCARPPATSSTGFDGARPRLRRGAERLRPSLHLLHHPLRPRQFALGADGRRGRADPRRWSRTAMPRSC